jgi:hypothetical protein
MDLATWEPVVRRVCEQISLPAGIIRIGEPGTYPTFIVVAGHGENKLGTKLIVVKFFGKLYEGHIAFRTERAVGKFIEGLSLPIPSPGILAEGRLDAPWSYLVYECVEGVSFSDVRQQLSLNASLNLGAQLGSFMHALHTLPLPANLDVLGMHPALGWQGFLSFLQQQRESCYANHTRWADLPTHFLDQLPGYLLPVDELVDQASPAHLIHADLTGDHLLGRYINTGSVPGEELSEIDQHNKGKRSRAEINEPSDRRRSKSVGNRDMDWQSLAVIDWGDARVGNILYELVAVHLDMFQSDLCLLKACLDHYPLPAFYRHDFARKMMCMTLLHQFPMPKQVYQPYLQLATLDELATGLFDY